MRQVVDLQEILGIGFGGSITTLHACLIASVRGASSLSDASGNITTPSQLVATLLLRKK